MMGHASTRMVDKVYGRLNADAYRAAIERGFGGASDAERCNEYATTSEPLMTIMTKLASAEQWGLLHETLETFAGSEGFIVPRGGVEPPTRGFSVRQPKAEILNRRAKFLKLLRGAYPPM